MHTRSVVIIRFTIQLDYKNRSIWFRMTPGWPIECPTLVNRGGVAFVREDAKHAPGKALHECVIQWFEDKGGHRRQRSQEFTFFGENWFSLFRSVRPSPQLVVRIFM